MKYIELNATGKILNLSKVSALELESGGQDPSHPFLISFRYEGQEGNEYLSYKTEEDRSTDYRKIIAFLNAPTEGLVSV